jgi:hypothetical protein
MDYRLLTRIHTFPPVFARFAPFFTVLDRTGWFPNFSWYAVGRCLCSPSGVATFDWASFPFLSRVFHRTIRSARRVALPSSRFGRPHSCGCCDLLQAAISVPYSSVETVGVGSDSFSASCSSSSGVDVCSAAAGVAAFLFFSDSIYFSCVLATFEISFL